jgi:hypothetical protein
MTKPPGVTCRASNFGTVRLIACRLGAPPASVGHERVDDESDPPAAYVPYRNPTAATAAAAATATRIERRCMRNGGSKEQDPAYNL